MNGWFEKIFKLIQNNNTDHKFLSVKWIWISKYENNAMLPNSWILDKAKGYTNSKIAKIL